MGRWSVEVHLKKLILVIFLLTIACTGQSKESSILEKSSCELPCWNSIVPGQTTETDLLLILENLPIVDQASIQNTNQAWSIFDNQVFFSFQQRWTLSQKPKVRGYAYLRNDIVSELILCGEINTPLKDIIEATGEPESVLSGDHIEQSGRLVILINSQKGISYSYTDYKTGNNQQYEITPDDPVGCIDLFDPTLYEKLLDATLLSGGHYNAEESLKVMYPWDGYGNLDEKYPPRRP